MQAKGAEDAEGVLMEMGDRRWEMGKRDEDEDED